MSDGDVGNPFDILFKLFSCFGVSPAILEEEEEEEEEGEGEEEGEEEEEEEEEEVGGAEELFKLLSFIGEVPIT